MKEKKGIEKAIDNWKESKKQPYKTTDCPQCGRLVKLKENINSCECGVRIKVLRY